MFYQKVPGYLSTPTALVDFIIEKYDKGKYVLKTAGMKIAD